MANQWSIRNGKARSLSFNDNGNSIYVALDEDQDDQDQLIDVVYIRLTKFTPDDDEYAEEGEGDFEDLIIKISHDKIDRLAKYFQQASDMLKGKMFDSKK